MSLGTRLHRLPEPLPAETEFSDSERGGDLTWHGPGQLVVYPIVKLGDSPFAPKADVTQYLRALEGVLIRLLAQYELTGEMRENATGVWIRRDGVERKIASIGIAVRKWVSYHGLALNAVNALDSFRAFAPCGYPGEVMTSLSEMRPLAPNRWRPDLEALLVPLFSPDFPARVQVRELGEIDIPDGLPAE